MSDQPQDLPAGAIPTPIDNPDGPSIGWAEPEPSDEETVKVVTASGTEIDVAKADALAAELIREGEEEPLPVGANDPETKPLIDGPPPGMPQEPDEIDERLARYVDALHRDTENYVGGRPDARNYPHVRPDQATVIDAKFERIHDIKPRSVREALLVQIARMTGDQRTAALGWAEAVRQQQEMRDAFLHYAEQVEGTEHALFALGLDVEDDHEKVEPITDLPRVPDSAIV